MGQRSEKRSVFRRKEFYLCKIFLKGQIKMKMEKELWVLAI